jgi:hypothetical protein
MSWNFEHGLVQLLWDQLVLAEVRKNNFGYEVSIFGPNHEGILLQMTNPREIRQRILREFGRFFHFRFNFDPK